MLHCHLTENSLPCSKNLSLLCMTLLHLEKSLATLGGWARVFTCCLRLSPAIKRVEIQSNGWGKCCQNFHFAQSLCFAAKPSQIFLLQKACCLRISPTTKRVWVQSNGRGECCQNLFLPRGCHLCLRWAKALLLQRSCFFAAKPGCNNGRCATR